MALYLVIHEPDQARDSDLQPPSRMLELAESHGREGARPQWLQAFSPDLHDDRLFTTWEAANAAEILATIERFGFLNDMKSTAIQVRAWGPHEILAASSTDD